MSENREIVNSSDEKLKIKASEKVKWILHVLNDEMNASRMFIIKVHLIMEHELNSYINNRTHNRLPVEKNNFSFSNKVKIAEMLGLFETEDDDGENLRKFIGLLNRIRNQFAHSFEHDDKLLNELHEIGLKYWDRIPIDTLEKNPTNVLLHVTSFFIGMLSTKHETDFYRERVIISEKKDDTKML